MNKANLAIHVVSILVTVLLMIAISSAMPGVYSIVMAAAGGWQIGSWSSTLMNKWFPLARS